MFHIIDDEDFVCDVITEIIEDHGYEAIAFGSPTDYISFVNSADFRTPIAVLTDVNMPAMNGYEMIDAVSKIRSGLKFVIMTAEYAIRSVDTDKACMFLGKPFNPDNLLKMLDSLIQCHSFLPADDHGCISADHREMFPIENWSCPHNNRDCSSDCS